MKTIFKSLTILVVFALLLSGCESGWLDQTNKKEVVFGDLSNMDVIYADTVLLGEYNHGREYSFDLDQDGQDDFALTSLIWGSPGMGMIPTSGIACKHENATLLGYYHDDTIFQHFDRRVYLVNDLVEIYETITTSCFRRDPADSIKNIEQAVFKLSDFGRDDTFDADDTFLSTDLTLATYWSRGWRETEYLSADTVLYKQWQDYNDCFSFPQNEIRYIGIRLDGERTRLGWIKVSVSEYFRVFILEGAIQK